VINLTLVTDDSDFDGCYVWAGMARPDLALSIDYNPATRRLQVSLAWGDLALGDGLDPSDLDWWIASGVMHYQCQAWGVVSANCTLAQAQYLAGGILSDPCYKLPYVVSWWDPDCADPAGSPGWGVRS